MFPIGRAAHTLGAVPLVPCAALRPYGTCPVATGLKSPGCGRVQVPQIVISEATEVVQAVGMYFGVAGVLCDDVQALGSLESAARAGVEKVLGKEATGQVAVLHGSSTLKLDDCPAVTILRLD